MEADQNECLAALKGWWWVGMGRTWALSWIKGWWELFSSQLKLTLEFDRERGNHRGWLDTAVTPLDILLKRQQWPWANSWLSHVGGSNAYHTTQHGCQCSPRGLKDSLLDVKHLLGTLSVKLLKCIKTFVFYAKLCLHSKLCLCVFWVLEGVSGGK